MSLPLANTGKHESRLTPERALTVVIVLGGFMAGLDTSLVNVGLTTVARNLHTSLGAVQWMTSGYLLALGAALPAGPWLQRRLGPSRLWLASLLLFTGASLACAVAPDLSVLLLARVVQGVAGGLLVPTGQSILARAVGADRMSRVMSTAGIAVVLAPAVGPALGGLLIDTLSWRWLFAVNLPIGAIAAVLGSRVLPRQAPNHDAVLDSLGLGLLSTALPALLFGLTRVGASPAQSWLGIALIVIGLALLLMFVVYTNRRNSEDLLLDLSPFRQPRYAAAQTTALFAGLGQYGGLILLPLYFEVLRGFSVIRTGLLLLVYGAGAMGGLKLGGRLVDRYGSGPTCTIGLLLTILSTAPFVAFSPSANLVVVEVLQALRGVGVGLSGIPALTAAIRAAPSAITDATITSNILQRVGGSLGSALIVLVASKLSPELHAVRAAHAVLIGTAAVALMSSIVLTVTERRKSPSVQTQA